MRRVFFGDEQDLQSDDEQGGQATERKIEDTEATILGGDVSLLKILLDHGALPDESTMRFSKNLARSGSMSNWTGRLDDA